MRKAPKIPPALLDDTVPRVDLQRIGFRPVAKSSDLRAYGYQIVIWFDPREMQELYEYVPQKVDPRTKQAPGPRVTVTTLAFQRIFHKAIGAPPPKHHALRVARNLDDDPAAFARELVASLGEEAEPFALEEALRMNTDDMMVLHGQARAAFWLKVYAAMGAR